jgi:flagellar protein FliO/FliZ
MIRPRHSLSDAPARHSEQEEKSGILSTGMNRVGLFSAFRATRILWMLWIVVAIVPPASAQEKAAEAVVIYPHSPGARTEPASRSGSGYASILVAAFLLAGAGGWLFWRGRTTLGKAAAMRKLAIAETKSLGNRQYLVVASYEDKKYLLGVCPGRIDLLTPLDGAPVAKSP